VRTCDWLSINRYVKERRPSISPNFNFLGQLVEYESQLQARTEDAIGAVSLPPSDQIQSNGSQCQIKICCPPAMTLPNDVAPVSVTAAIDECPTRSPSPVKRPCLTDVSQPSSMSHDPMMTVSSQLSSSSASASVQRRFLETSSLSTLLGDASVKVVQSPTTAMSKLNFELHVVAGGTSAAATATYRGSARSNHVKLAASSSSGVSNQLYGCSNGQSSTVALSPSPLLGTRIVHGSTSSASGQADVVGAALGVTTRENRQLIAWTTPTRQQFALMYGRGADVVDPPCSRPVPESHDLLWQQVQQASMKSRSFEDILLLSKDSDLATSAGWATRGRLSGVDLADNGDDVADETVADGGVVPPSLSGHGGSLHGSLEMIQVS